MTKIETSDYLRNIENEAVHGKNFLAKLNNEFGNSNSFESVENMNFFFEKYKNYREKILNYSTDIIKNIDIIVDELNIYKSFVYENNKFSSQSKFESTILEEFIFYLFKNLIYEEKIKLGSVNAYCNLYFSPKNITTFVENPSIKINTKNQDFSIYRRISINVEESVYNIDVPIVAVECKTYLDKTMLEGSIATAEKVKMGNPHSKYFIVTETYEVDFNVDICFSRIDQIFVLRKQKRRTAKNNKIFSDVVLSLYKQIEKHLNSDWIDIEKNINLNGVVL